MRSQVAALIGFCLVVGGVAGQGTGKGGDKQIEGSWTLVSMEKGGNKKDAANEGIRLALKGGKMSMSKGDESKQGSYKVDAAKKPKHITLMVEDKEIQGIYDVKGDTLRICAGQPGDPRPTAFKADDGNSMILTWSRDKKKADK